MDILQNFDIQIHDTKNISLAWCEGDVLQIYTPISTFSKKCTYEEAKQICLALGLDWKYDVIID